MRVPLFMLFVALACAVAACGARTPRGSGASATTSPQATAHIDVHGVIRLTHDIDVTRCYVGKPGPKLLSGYSATFGSDDVVEGGEILVPEFTGDGTYDEAAAKHEAISRVLSWVILNIGRGPGFPHGTTLEEQPDTRVTIVIKDRGSSGRAQFSNYRSLYAQNGDERGGAVFGTITWTCPAVERSPAL